MLPLELELLLGAALGELGVAGVALEPLAPEVPPELEVPLPEAEESDEPEVPLAAGAAPEGAGEDELDEELEGELDEGEGVAEGVDDEDEPAGEAPDEDDDEVSAPAAGVLGVVVLLLLVLGVAGLVLAAPLEDDPGAEPEVPVPLPESLLQPASSAVRRLAANRIFEGWVSFIVAFLLKVNV